MNRIAVYALLGAIRALALLPLEWQRQLGRWLGWLAWKFRIDAARVTRINLTRCFPDIPPRERESLVLASLQATAQVLTESGMIFHWPQMQWSRLIVRIEGEALIEDALERGEAVLVLVPHLGNWEYLSLYLGRFEVTALYDPPRLRGLEAPIRRARSRAGANLVPIGRHGLKTVYETLTHAGVVALLPDQVPDRAAGVYADFFGKPALTMTFALRLIARTRPMVIMGSAVRAPGGFALRFVEAEQGIYSADVRTAAAAMNRSIERMVCEAPDQYQWEYKRFKRPPPGESDCYRSDPISR